MICITHLPQIAAMADCHYEIAKSVEKGKTTTRICRLEEDAMVEELARLLGGRPDHGCSEAECKGDEGNGRQNPAKAVKRLLQTTF